MAKIDDEGMVTIGLSSKYADLVCRHLWTTMFIVIILTEAVLDCIDVAPIQVIAVRWMLLVTLSPSLLFLQAISLHWCYKIRIDHANNLIHFHRFFNRGVDTMPMKDITILIGWYCNIYIKGTKHVLHLVFAPDLVAYLPADTVIEYAGWIGRSNGDGIQKFNGPLIPGNKLQQSGH